MNLNIAITENDNTTVVNLSGEIDIYTAPKLKEALIPLTKTKGHLLEINLNDVGYMDSTGLGVFISVLKSTREHDSHFKLKNLQDRVARLFSITGLNEIMEIDEEKQGLEVEENDRSIWFYRNEIPC